MRCTEYVKRYIEAQPVLRVRSVYRRTVNLCREDELISLHPRKVLPSPVSVILPLNEQEFLSLSLAARREGSISFKEDRLWIGSRSWKTGLMETWDSKIRLRLEQKKLLCLAEVLKRFLLKQKDMKESFGAAAALTQEELKEVISEDKIPETIMKTHPVKRALCCRLYMLRQCGRGDISALAREAEKMIGLGIGLTPSGDDFLTGILLAFWADGAFPVEKIGLFCAELDGFLGNTNRVGRQYLRCAGRGEFGEIFLQLLEKTKNQASDWYDIEETLEKIGRIGHSSGIDTLNGLLTGLDMRR